MHYTKINTTASHKLWTCWSPRLSAPWLLYPSKPWLPRNVTDNSRTMDFKEDLLVFALIQGVTLRQNDPCPTGQLSSQNSCPTGKILCLSLQSLHNNILLAYMSQKICLPDLGSKLELISAQQPTLPVPGSRTLNMVRPALNQSR